MDWISKDDEMPELGKTVLFGYIVSGWKEYDVDIYNGIKGVYVIGANGHIVCLNKEWKYWMYIKDF